MYTVISVIIIISIQLYIQSSLGIDDNTDCNQWSLAYNRERIIAIIIIVYLLVHVQ